MTPRPGVAYDDEMAEPTETPAIPAPLEFPIPFGPDMFSGCPPMSPPLIGFGGKWTPKILRSLEGAPRRFTELQTVLRGITPKVLTESLRAMERDGLLTRTAYDEVPARVEYELTDLGRSLLVPMTASCEWSRRHLPDLLRARASWHGTPRSEAELI
jgi:DNA-binding HxlR family transcriptional regulator